MKKEKLSFIQKIYLDNIDHIRQELTVNQTDELVKSLTKTGIVSSYHSDTTMLSVDEEETFQRDQYVLLIPMSIGASIECVVRGEVHQRENLKKPTILSPNKEFRIKAKQSVDIFMMNLSDSFHISSVRYSFLNDNKW